MSLPRPQPGLVIRYAYLWKREYDQGRDEGSKDRPCAIVMTVPRIRVCHGIVLAKGWPMSVYRGTYAVDM